MLAKYTRCIPVQQRAVNSKIKSPKNIGSPPFFHGFQPGEIFLIWPNKIEHRGSYLLVIYCGVIFVHQLESGSWMIMVCPVMGLAYSPNWFSCEAIQNIPTINVKRPFDPLIAWILRMSSSKWWVGSPSCFQLGIPNATWSTRQPCEVRCRSCTCCRCHWFTSKAPAWSCGKELG